MLIKHLRLRQVILSITLLGFLFIACGASARKPILTIFDDSISRLYIERDSLTGETISVEVVIYPDENIRVGSKYVYPSFSKRELQIVVDTFVKESIMDEECLTDEDKKALDVKTPNWESYRCYYYVGYLRKGLNYIVSCFV